MNTEKVRTAVAKAAAGLAALSSAPADTLTKSAMDILKDTAGVIARASLEGMRVNVMDGSGRTEIGRGTIVDHVTVYVQQTAVGIQSHRFAEEPQEGFQPLGENPKFLMDDGTYRYGCQVWWQPIESEPADA